MPAGGSLKPASQETVAGREHFLRQNGRVVFKFAVSQMAEMHRACCSSGTGSPPPTSPW